MSREKSNCGEPRRGGYWVNELAWQGGRYKVVQRVEINRTTGRRAGKFLDSR